MKILQGGICLLVLNCLDFHVAFLPLQSPMLQEAHKEQVTPGFDTHFRGSLVPNQAAWS